MNEPQNYFDVWLLIAKPCSVLPMTVVTQCYIVDATLKRKLCLCWCYFDNETSFVKKQCPWLKIVHCQASAVHAQQSGHYTDSRTKNMYVQGDSVKRWHLVLFCSWSCFWDNFFLYFITSYTNTCNILQHPLPLFFIYLQNRLKNSSIIEFPQINSCYRRKKHFAFHWSSDITFANAQEVGWLWSSN